MKGNTVREMADFGCQKLTDAGAGSPRLDAELLLARALGKDRHFLYTHPGHCPDGQAVENYFDLIAQRVQGMPLQYLTGSQEFMGLEFNINPSVLIPRPDTETLVEAVLEWLKQHSGTGSIRALDIGTGSGAIAVSLAYYYCNLTVTAVDISSRALQTARDNAMKHGVGDRVEFVEGDLFPPVTGTGTRFDLIVSNPPYISRQEMGRLQREVLKEPEIALDGGTDGLSFYKKIAAQAPFAMKRKGLLAVEIGYNQAKDVRCILDKTGRYNHVRVIRDLAGRDRVVLAETL